MGSDVESSGERDVAGHRVNVIFRVLSTWKTHLHAIFSATIFESTAQMD